MKKINYSKVILSLTAVLFLSLGANNIVLGYGDGDFAGSKAPETTKKVTKLSDEEIKRIFSLLDAKSRETMTNVFSGSNRTARELMRIRQAILEGDMKRANAEASLINGLTVTVEFLDQAGQWSQFGLSFVPGVGWVTAGVLDTARGGVNAYRDGKSASEILKDATIAGVSSVTINKLSPLGADKTYNGAKTAWNIITKGSGKHTGKAVKIFIKNGVKFLGKKEIERRAGNVLSAGLNNSTKQAPNRAPMPTYINSSLGYDVTPMGTKVYK